jgi:hypothetical protein
VVGNCDGVSSLIGTVGLLKSYPLKQGVVGVGCGPGWVADVNSASLSASAAVRYTSFMATTEHGMTAEQLFQTPDLGRCELVRGELIIPEIFAI